MIRVGDPITRRVRCALLDTLRFVEGNWVLFLIVINHDFHCTGNYVFGGGYVAASPELAVGSDRGRDVTGLRPWMLCACKYTQHAVLCAYKCVVCMHIHTTPHGVCIQTCCVHTNTHNTACCVYTNTHNCMLCAYK